MQLVVRSLNQVKQWHRASFAAYTLPFFALIVWCPKSNILTRFNMFNITSNSVLLSDLSRIYEGQRGEDFLVAPHVIELNFNNPICVTDILVQRTAPSRTASNAAKIAVRYRTSNGTNVVTPDGRPLVLQSPDNNPTITEDSLRCDIQGIQVTILNTTDQRQPSFVRLMVIGCYAPSNIPFFHLVDAFADYFQ